jgi:hypothetical protein
MECTGSRIPYFGVVDRRKQYRRPVGQLLARRVTLSYIVGHEERAEGQAHSAAEIRTGTFSRSGSRTMLARPVAITYKGRHIQLLWLADDAGSTSRDGDF